MRGKKAKNKKKNIEYIYNVNRLFPHLKKFMKMKEHFVVVTFTSKQNLVGVHDFEFMTEYLYNQFLNIYKKDKKIIEENKQIIKDYIYNEIVKIISKRMGNFFNFDNLLF